MKFIFIALIALFVSAAPTAQAGSCLMPYDIATLVAVDTCVTQENWDESLVLIDDQSLSCVEGSLLDLMSANLDEQVCEQWMDGQFSESNDCDAQGVLDGHLGHTCPY